MADAPATSLDPQRSAEWAVNFDRHSQIQAGLLAIAFVAVFYHTLQGLKFYWLNSPDWSHGPIVPLFSIYLVYVNWPTIKRQPLRHTWIGLIVMIAALAAYQACLWGSIPFGYARPTAMLLCLLGIIVFLCGLPAMRYLWVPWLFLFFSVPLPKGIYFQLTDPLRRIAATVATSLLNLAPALEIERVGSKIEYYYQGATGEILVADACSGMRTAIGLCAAGVAVAFLAPRPWWHRVLMVAACVPIAIFSNFIRVTATCVLHIFVDPKYAGGDYHTAMGLLTFVIALLIFLGLGWLLANLFVESESDGEAQSERGAAPGASV